MPGGKGEDVGVVVGEGAGPVLEEGRVRQPQRCRRCLGLLLLFLGGGRGEERRNGVGLQCWCCWPCCYRFLLLRSLLLHHRHHRWGWNCCRCCRLPGGFALRGDVDAEGGEQGGRAALP